MNAPKDNFDTTQIKIGTRLDINEECIGVITKETDSHFFIESDIFTGWATKEEIIEAILLAID